MTATGQILRTMSDAIHPGRGKCYVDYPKIKTFLRTFLQDTTVIATLDPLTISVDRANCATETEISWPPPLLLDGWIGCSVGTAATTTDDARRRRAPTTLGGGANDDARRRRPGRGVRGERRAASGARDAGCSARGAGHGSGRGMRGGARGADLASVRVQLQLPPLPLLLWRRSYVRRRAGLHHRSPLPVLSLPPSPSIQSPRPPPSPFPLPPPFPPTPPPSPPSLH